MSSSVNATYLPGNNTNNDFQLFQQQIMANANSTATSANNNMAAKNRMTTLTLGNVGSSSTTNRNSVGGTGSAGEANNGSANNKTFDAYPFLPPPPSQPLNAQHPLSPTYSPMRQQQSSTSNQSGAMLMAQQQQSARSTFSLDRIAASSLQSNSNQKLNQSNSTDQSSQQQQHQHDSMLSPSRHLPFPYSNLNNYHRNF